MRPPTPGDRDGRPRNRCGETHHSGGEIGVLTHPATPLGLSSRFRPAGGSASQNAGPPGAAGRSCLRMDAVAPDAHHHFRSVAGAHPHHIPRTGVLHRNRDRPCDAQMGRRRPPRMEREMSSQTGIATGNACHHRAPAVASGGSNRGRNLNAARDAKPRPGPRPAAETPALPGLRSSRRLALIQISSGVPGGRQPPGLPQPWGQGLNSPYLARI